MTEKRERWAIGIEIGGTKLQVVLGNTSGALGEIRRGGVDPSAGAAGILAWFEAQVPAALEAARDQGCAPACIGVGFGGPVESATGRVLTSHQIAGWQGLELRRWFEERFGLPTVVANDANAAGWAEYCLGAGKGTRQFCYMNIGSGIGGALVVDGRLYDGQGFGAGEIGHTYVPDWTGPPGTADKLEHLCSGWAIERRVRAWSDLDAQSPLGRLCGGDAQAITCAMLAQAAEEGDSRALEEIERVAGSVAWAVANVMTLFHPERLALGGGVSLMGEVLIEPLRREVAKRVFGPFRERYAIVPCALAESVVLAGAILLALSGEHT
jgi:glucokinase